MEPDLMYKVLLRSPFCARWKRWGRGMPGAPGIHTREASKYTIVEADHRDWGAFISLEFFMQYWE